MCWGRALGPFGGLSAGQLMLPAPHGRKKGLWIVTIVILSSMTDVDKSSRCISPEVLSTMTSQHQRCHDNYPDVSRRRRAAVHDTEAPSSPPTVSRRYPISCPAAPHRDDDRSTGTGSSCSEPHVTPRDDDVTKVGGMTTVHRRRRRTAFTNDQVNTKFS